MSLLEFKTEEEKLEYIQYISGLIKPISESINKLEQAKEDSQDLNSVVKKAEDLALMIWTANNFYQTVRDKYLPENTSLTYAQERAILNCLHEVAKKIVIGHDFEYSTGAWYEIEKSDIASGVVLEKEFIKALMQLDLAQDKTRILTEENSEKHHNI